MDALEGMWTELAKQVADFDPRSARANESASQRLVLTDTPHAVVLETDDTVWQKASQWRDDTTFKVPQGGAHLFVGFVLPAEASETPIEISIGDKFSVTTTLQPGKLTLALENTQCIPLVNLAYNEVIVKCKMKIDGLELVYGYINREDLRTLAVEGNTKSMVLQLATCHMSMRSGMVDAVDLDTYQGTRYVVPAIN